MPPAEEGSALLPDQIALIRTWIQQGAAAADEQTPTSPTQHWAFQKIERPTIPATFANSQLDNPIDALLAAKRAELGLRTQPQATRSILIRRLYLDLIGLPPTHEQLDDERPWHQIVDELLASPHHGERWARHWMDIWRYCDWYGLGTQLRFSQKHLWHWRDWIVDSLNEDIGYDRMILEMLAGDELAPDDPEVIVATGYLARNYYLFNRTSWLDNTIEHTSKAFLGLTMNCAKCHDHKYDPITHVDYYRFRAIFEPHQVRLDPIPGVTDFEQDGLPRVFDDHVDIETYLHLRGDPKNPDKDRKIDAGVPAILASFATEIKPIALPVSAYAPGARSYVQGNRLDEAQTAIAAAEQQVTEAKKKLAEMPDEEPEPSEETPFQIDEEFDQPNSELWKLIGDGWQYRDGALHQTTSTHDPQLVRLLRPLPRDFELSCDYTTTGGATYKSVTFRFDQSEDNQYANYVYSSAHAPGPKVQVALTRQGTSTYPATGRRNFQIEVGKRYQLRFAVRGTLVNVWLDDQFLIAYRLPDRRDGFLSLSGFDATVAFDSITIRSLSNETVLTEAQNKIVASVSDAPAAVAVAEAKLAAAKAKVRSIEATIAADTAKFRPGEAANEAAEAARRAARLQAESQKALATYQMLADAADSNKLGEAKKQLAAANKKLADIETGEFQYESIRGAKKALETPADKEQDYPATYSPTSTGRRLALAKWIASAENPLTARVAVNHVWMRHFGTPLVESVFDFGLRAKQPLHSELIDLLAAEFIDSGWSFQHLHRLIVTSQTYQLGSSNRDCEASTMAADPSNQYYWRMNSRRMESQVVRDSFLKLAGKLDTKIGGPSIDPGANSRRRSIYFKSSPDQQDKFLNMFDDADVLQCYRRSESIVPQQALALSNSSLSIEMAANIAEQISTSLDDPNRGAFIEETFYLLLGRTPIDSETSECARFFADMATINAGAQADETEKRIRARFVQAILNHNDFISIR